MKINSKTLINISVAILAGVVAFLNTIESQKKDEKIKNLEARIDAIEENK